MVPAVVTRVREDGIVEGRVRQGPGVEDTSIIHFWGVEASPASPGHTPYAGPIEVGMRFVKREDAVGIGGETIKVESVSPKRSVAPTVWFQRADGTRSYTTDAGFRALYVLA